MVRTDIFRRGVPWMLLIKRTGTVETDLNVKGNQKASVALTGLTLIAAVLSLFRLWLAPVVGMGLAAIIALNRPLFAFFARRRGLGFALAALPLHLVYYCCCGISVVIATVHWQLRGPRMATGRPDSTAVPVPHLSAKTRVSRGQAKRNANDAEMDRAKGK